VRIGLVCILGAVEQTRHAAWVFVFPQYKNVRPDYVKEVWKVVNWKNVGENLAAAK
jgi:Fe-Mn family superoxide dismutase